MEQVQIIETLLKKMPSFMCPELDGVETIADLEYCCGVECDLGENGSTEPRWNNKQVHRAKMFTANVGIVAAKFAAEHPELVDEMNEAHGPTPITRRFQFEVRVLLLNGYSYWLAMTTNDQGEAEHYARELRTRSKWSRNVISVVNGREAKRWTYQTEQAMQAPTARSRITTGAITSTSPPTWHTRRRTQNGTSATPRSPRG